MTLTKYYPGALTGYNTVGDFIDRFFDSTFKGDVRYDFVPASDIKETDKAYVITMDIPGMVKDDLNVKLEKRILTISGEKKFEEKKEGDKYHLKESRYGSFERSFRLPDDIDAEKIDAGVENGVLTVEIQKLAKALPKTIDIKIK